MIRICGALFVILCFAGFSTSQTKPLARSTPPIVPVKPGVDPGMVVGRTYRNNAFGFEITFPDAWLIPDGDFEAIMKKQGFDVSLKVPPGINPQAQAKLDEYAKNVTLLLTAYRSMPG